MHIREADFKDIPQIVTLGKSLFDIHKCFDPEYYDFEENFPLLFEGWVRDQIGTYNQFILVAEENNDVVGFISGFVKSLFPWFKNKTVGHISYLAVSENDKRKGIGRALENTAVEWFRKKNIKYMELYVDEVNTVANIAWEKYSYLPFKKFLRKKI